MNWMGTEGVRGEGGRERRNQEMEELMMEHGESWTGKRWAQAGAGKNEERQERGFGRWRQEEEEAVACHW